MKYVFFAAFFFFGLNQLLAQPLPFVKAAQITKWQNNTSDTLYILNFWATWCKPCVTELPAFEKIQAKYKDKKVKVILVSNDFKKQIGSKLMPFIKENGIKSEVVFMDEPNPNTWLEWVDKDWSGALPATLFIKGNIGFKKFHEGELTFEELEAAIKQLIP
jgi:thiol-disulfide isomerase/thioredoxin